MIPSPSAARIADTLRAILARGLDLTPDTLRFIDSTFSQPSAAELAAILKDDDAPEGDSLLELLFAPDDALQIELQKDRLSLQAREPLTPEAVVQQPGEQPVRDVRGNDHVGEDVLAEDELGVVEDAPDGKVGLNVETQLPVEVRDLLDGLRVRESGERVGGRHERLITFVKDRPGHDRRYAIDARKIGRELHWVPQESFDSGMRRTVRWYLDNRAWLTAVTSGEYQQWISLNYRAGAA